MVLLISHVSIGLVCLAIGHTAGWESGRNFAQRISMSMLLDIFDRLSPVARDELMASAAQVRRSAEADLKNMMRASKI